MVNRLRASRLAQNLRQSWEQAAPLLFQLAAAGFAALLAGTELMDGLAPFGIALVAGAPPSALLAVSAGAVAGSAISLPFTVSGQYLAGVLAAAGVRFLLLRRRGRVDAGAAASFAGAAVLLVVGIFYTARLGGGPAAVLKLVPEGMLAIGMAMIFSLALPPLLAGNRMADQPETVQGAAVLCAAVALCALFRLAPGGLNLGLVAFGPLALTLALIGPGPSAVMSVACALLLYLSRPQDGWMGLSLAAAALAAAAFRDRGRPAMAACYFAASCLGVFGAEDPVTGLWFLAAAGCGALVFLLLPRPALERLRADRRADAIPASLPGRLSDRLYALSDALCQVGRTVEQVCSRMPGPQITLNELYDRIAQGPCAGCGGRLGCWVARCSDTLNGLTDLVEQLRQGREVTAETLPPALARSCTRQAVFAGAVNRYYADYLTRRAVAVRTGALRTALTQQYTALAGALGTLAQDLFEETVLDNRRAARVSELFSSLSLPPLDVSVTLTRDGRCRVSVKLTRSSFSEEELRELCGEVSACCGRRFSCGYHTARGSASLLEFSEAAPFEVRFATAGRSAAGGVSADAVQTFCDLQGRAHIILCDGMGTGKAAAVDGVLAATLSRQLIDAGFAGESAARLVNVALSLKGEDAGAALDLLTVDLYTGRCDLFKAGAAPTYLVRRGKAVTLGAKGLPVGLLEGVVGASAHAALADGSLAVMVSDGVIAAGDEWLLAELERLCGESAQTVADTLLEGALRRQGGHPDDVTVAVLRLERHG
ncbi:MAG TPA: serine/threonine-protein phosphatase [Candidatus Pygmaiobacter gallistercoris]|nr:serine/threonine-protein phosphatase [Candidatus Pygmaiobacter gallistercoris]